MVGAYATLHDAELTRRTPVAARRASLKPGMSDPAGDAVRRE
ncbi:hypothetical protein ACFFHJ_12370 [Planotetraspora thailandica]|nr:hypothetical protein [Planotetraspora thailandica]